MNRKPRTYWMHWQHLAAALEPFMSEHGYLPTQRELRAIGLSTLVRVFNYFGGHAMVARRLGVPTAPEFHRSRLSNWDTFCNEMAPLVAQRGYFPTVSELVREARHDLIFAIRRYHGGAADAAQRMGISTYNAFHGHKSAGYWTKERIIAAYRDVIRTHSFTHWPSPNDLIHLGYGVLRGAMQKIGYRRIREILVAEGITLSAKPRKLGNLVPFTQQFPLVDEIFSKCELFHYFLGLVAADGSFVSTRHEESVELCLKAGDIELLEKLRDRISPARPIHRKPNKTNPLHEAARLKINDRRLVGMLKEHITTVDKSHTLSWPETLPDDQRRHFIRGYIDGDGTIGITLNRQTVRGRVRFYPVLRLRVLGTETFLTGMTRAIHRIQDIKPVKVHRKGRENIYEIQYSGRHAEKILDWLYDGATIFLARKRGVYLYLRNADREMLLANYRTPAGRYNTIASGKAG